MTAPVVISMATDKPSYVKGDTVRVTVRYTPGTSDATTTTTYTATDTGTGQLGTLTITWAVANGNTDPTVGKMTDDKGRTYSLVSDDGSTAVWQTIA